MMCFEHLTKTVAIFCYVLMAVVAKYGKIHCYFLKFQTVWYNTIGFELPRGGRRAHARKDGRETEQVAHVSRLKSESEKRRG